MALEVLPTTSEFADDRGLILTWVPPEPIAEYNLITSKAGALRGLHYHPEFTEYLLFISGTGRMRWKHGEESGVVDIHRGLATRAVPGVAHAVEADEDLTFVAMLTKPWDDCREPIIMVDM